MTLIELLYNYREIIRYQGREAADQFLYDTTAPEIIPHIQSSVADDGLFIKADKEVFEPLMWT